MAHFVNHWNFKLQMLFNPMLHWWMHGRTSHMSKLSSVFGSLSAINKKQIPTWKFTSKIQINWSRLNIFLCTQRILFSIHTHNNSNRNSSNAKYTFNICYLQIQLHHRSEPIFFWDLSIYKSINQSRSMY